MQRRKFIINTIKSLPVILFTKNSFAINKKDSGNKAKKSEGNKVIVIGGGISGLAAAKRLTNKGYSVIVLESQDKIGGRIRTDYSLGIPFEEGANWIHGPKGNPITTLSEKAGANTYLTDDDNEEVFDINGIPYNKNFLEIEYKKYKRQLKEIMRKGEDDKSFEDVFTSLYPLQISNRLWKYMLSAYLEFDTGGDISNLSSKYFDDDELFSGKDIIITNGYDKIPKLLGKELDIRLNSRVKKIDYSSNKSIVEVNGEKIESDYVIVAVPLGVLKNNSIEFVPKMSSQKQVALRNTNMGVVNKFLLIWDTSFWNTNLQYIGYTPDTKGKFNYYVNMLKFLPNTNGLMTFAFGNYALETEKMTDEEIIKEVMDELKIIYGKNIPNPTKLLRTQWGQNINSFGSYSYATNGTTSDDFDILSTEINNKIFFAGEHTSKEFRGTVHGAYLSGIREANKILAL